MLITNTCNIQEVLLFPAMKPDLSGVKKEEKKEEKIEVIEVKPESK